MPKLTTYANASEEHVLDKSLTKIEDQVDIEFKENSNIINPIIILSRERNINFNYVYLTSYN